MGDSDLIDAGMKAGFGPLPDESVLRRLEAHGGKPPRVRLNGPDGSPEPPPIAAPVRYQILGEIARGGVGVVLHGRDSDLGRDVAMKVLRPEYAENREILERFLEEAQVGGQLQHPGIVPVYEMGLDAQKRAYFTMKLVKGQTLAALLKERPEPGADRRRFLTIYEQVAQTVAYAHARGVIHRDLKPSNVMVGAFGEVVVLDWGFAKVLAQGGVADERPRDETVVRTRRAGSGSESQAGSILGTPAYMPPEQALGQVEAVDTRADAFSLGAILCEILTGKPPYAGGSNDMLILAAQGRVEDALARLDGSGADDALVQLAKRCLDPVPSKRPRDAGAVAQAVAAHLARVDERARVAELDAAQARVKALAERRARRLTAGLAAAVVLTLAAGGGGALWGEGERRARADRTRADVSRALTEARALYGEAQNDATRWEAALAAARKAQSLAEAGGLADREAATLVAHAEAERREEGRERLLRTRLDESRAPAPVDGPSKRAARAVLSQALREYGIDVEALGDDEALRLMRESRIPLELAEALDSWAMRIEGVRGPLPDEARRLLRLAKAVDPDPFRCRLRDGLLSTDSALLLELAAAPDALTNGPAAANRLSVALWDARERAAAVKLMRDAQRKWPDNFWLNYRLASALRDLDPPQHEEEAHFYAVASALRPDFVTARDMLGHALQHCNDVGSAIEVFRGAIRSDPSSLYLHNCLAGAHKARGDLEEAVAHWREEARAAPSDATAQLRLGEGLLYMTDVAGAVAAFREAVRLAPDIGYLHHELGRALQFAGDIKGAVVSYRASAEREPDIAHRRMSLATALAAAGELDEAIRILEDLVRWETNPRVRMYLGEALLQGGRLDEAETTLREALESAPNMPRAHYQLGLALRQKGDIEGAIHHDREAIRLKPDEWFMRRELADLLFEQGRYEEVRQVLDAAAAREPQLGYPHYLYGLSLMREGNLEEALPRLRRAGELRRHPSWEEDLRHLIAECEFAFAQKDALSAILSGERRPADPKEARDLANLCFNRLCFARASELYGIALEGGQPVLYWAAHAAGRAGTGGGRDAPEAPALRGTALERMRRLLAAQESGFAADPGTRSTARWTARSWQRDPAFAGMRGAALDQLPPPEREAWAIFWHDVDAFLERLRQ